MPRHYAAEIAQLPEHEQDAAVEQRVPPKFRDWVRKYLHGYGKVGKRCSR